MLFDSYYYLSVERFVQLFLTVKYATAFAVFRLIIVPGDIISCLRLSHSA
jgi:hypothetical protein